MVENLYAYFISVFSREDISSLLVPDVMFEGESQNTLDTELKS